MSDISGAPLAGDTNAAEKSVLGSNPSEKQPNCRNDPCKRVAKVAGRFCNVCFVECLYRAVKMIEEEISTEGAKRSRAGTMPNNTTTKPDIKLVRRKTMLVLYSTDKDHPEIAKLKEQLQKELEELEKKLEKKLLEDLQEDLQDLPEDEQEEPGQSLSERRLNYFAHSIKKTYKDCKKLWDEVFIPMHDGTPLTPLTEIKLLENCLGIGIERELGMMEPGRYTRLLNERVDELRKQKIADDREAFQERAGGAVRWLFELCNGTADHHYSVDAGVANNAGNVEEESNDEEPNGESGSTNPSAAKRSRSNEEENQSEADGSKPVEEVKKTEEETMESDPTGEE